MNIEVPYKIGDRIEVNGVDYVIRGIHIYITQDSDVIKWRFHIGRGKFVTIENSNTQGGLHERKEKKKVTRDIEDGRGSPFRP